MENAFTLKCVEFEMPADNLEDRFREAVCHTGLGLKAKCANAEIWGSPACAPAARGPSPIWGFVLNEGCSGQN